MPYLIGLDVGTTGAKALLVNLKGNVVASETAEYPLYTPRPLWAEQNPEEWWEATQRSFRSVLAKAGVGANKVLGVGLTGQMHGLVLMDKKGKVIRPCIMWNDQRTAAQCSAITNKVGFLRLMELTANPVLPGFTAPKILWVRENEPSVLERVAHVLLPKDYIRYRLTGEFATDVSDASGTSLLNVQGRRWSEELLGILEIEAGWLPRVHESPEVTGRVMKSAEEVTGLRPGTPVVAGAGDQAAGAVGNGIVQAGMVSVTVGTSGVVFAHTEKLAVEPQGRLHAFCHAVPHSWHLMGVTLAAGGSLRWFRDNLSEVERSRAVREGKDSYDILMAEAAGVPAGSEGLLFLPYLSGERTPYPDPHAKGGFIGLTMRHSKAHLIRSLLEGVAFSLRDCLELIKGLGLRIEQVRVSGGGARSEIWRQILSEVLATELVTLASTEGAPYGAALLAGVGAGAYHSVRSACEETVRVMTRTKPQPGRSRVYEDLYSIYREMYPLLKSTFHAISDIGAHSDSSS